MKKLLADYKVGFPKSGAPELKTPALFYSFGASCVSPGGGFSSNRIKGM